MCMKKFLLIVLAILLTNISAFAVNYDRYDTQRDGVYTPSGCPECRRVRKRFAKPVTRFAQPKPRQKAGYYKTGMNLRYRKSTPNKSVYNRPVQLSRFDKNYTIVQAKKTTCNGVTYYGPNNICE